MHSTGLAKRGADAPKRAYKRRKNGVTQVEIADIPGNIEEIVKKEWAFAYKTPSLDIQLRVSGDKASEELIKKVSLAALEGA